MDTQSEEIERVWRVAEALNGQEVGFLEQELEHAEALMKWPSEEGSLHSDSEWDNSDSELSDQDDLKLNIPKK